MLFSPFFPFQPPLARLACSCSLLLDLSLLFSSLFLRSPPLFAQRFSLPLQHALMENNKQDFKGSDFGWHKTKIAQMLTIKRERELAEGVSKRDSRAAEKRTKVEAWFGQF